MEKGAWYRSWLTVGFKRQSGSCVMLGSGFTDGQGPGAAERVSGPFRILHLSTFGP